MKYFLICISLFCQLTHANEVRDIVINEDKLQCVAGMLTLKATEIEDLVKGNYPGFKFEKSFELVCFVAQVIFDKARSQNDKIAAKVSVTTELVKEPIQECHTPPRRSCPFSDCEDICRVIGYKEYELEKVSIDLFGLNFFANAVLDK